MHIFKKVRGREINGILSYLSTYLHHINIAFLSLPRKIPLSMLARLHFIPQLEIHQELNVTLPTLVIFSYIFVVIIPDSQLP